MTQYPDSSPEKDRLYQRVQAFQFDDREAAFPFHARLARENGWSEGYTARVISEYRRFVFLALAAGHPVTPSDQVDQAWHLHLLYTNSYWNRFCGETLGRRLHHGPTQGGASERDKFTDWYLKTLQSYQHWFDREPPPDIWPPAGVRFGQDIVWQRVNVTQHWVIPYSRLRGFALPAISVLIIILLLLI